MISSTSTTSTSGVMLISEFKLEPPLSNCMMSIPPCWRFSALGNQAHSAKACILDREHGLPDFAEIELGVAPDHDLRVRLVAHRNAEGFAEILGGDRLFVDPQLAGIVDGDQNPASLIALTDRLCRVRQVDLRSLPH